LLEQQSVYYCNIFIPLVGAHALSGSLFSVGIASCVLSEA